MAETEVESILREIRERVLSGQRAGQDIARRSRSSTMSNGENGAGDSALGSTPDSEAIATESLALINSYLTTTARAWDRLPPVVSNRSGLLSRLELWLKRRLRAGTRWFTWEQVNFNAAVHHALRDMLPVWSAYEQELGKLRAQIDAEAEARRNDFEEHQTKLTALQVEMRAELRAEVEAQRLATDAYRIQVEARLTEILGELRERNEHILGEQRVCFKQLALETSEAAVLEDRARRKTEALLAELGRRIEQLEKSDE